MEREEKTFSGVELGLKPCPFCGTIPDVAFVGPMNVTRAKIEEEARIMKPEATEDAVRGYVDTMFKLFNSSTYYLGCGCRCFMNIGQYSTLGEAVEEWNARTEK